MATILTKKSIPAGLLALLGLLLPAIGHAETDEEWIDSRPLLVESPRPVAPHALIFTKPIYGAIYRSLMNHEQHRQLLDLQARSGTRPQEARLRSLSVHKLTANEATARPTEVTQSMSTFLGREFKSSALPEVLRTGISFDLGGKSSHEPAPLAQPLRYGLIVTSMEPSPEALRIAALPVNMIDEYAMVSHAPKARITYKIGPLMNEQDLADSPIPLASADSSSWTSRLPEFQFRGRIAARGAPTANQIIPPQSILLEQTQGYYALEVHSSQLVHKDAVFHRIRLPLIGSMSLREERDEKFKKTRSTIENLYTRGPLTLNLDYFGLEKRYQTGLIYQKALTRIELYNHLPENFADQDSLWKTQRYELKVQTAF